MRPLRHVIPIACAAWSCDSLPDLRPNQCGNGVLEPTIGEACDSKVDETLGRDLACGEADSVGQCRYVCADATCPTGWECGLDRICREPAGRFALGPTGIVTLFAPMFALGDIDADGREDLVVHANREVSAFFGDGGGGLVQRFDVTATPATGRLVAHDVTGDAGIDVLAPLREGLLVLRGRGDRTLAPEVLPSFAPFDLMGGRSRTASVDVSGQAESSLITFRRTAGAVVAEPLFPSGAALSIAASDLPDAVKSADLEPPDGEATGTQEVILAFGPERLVRIIELICDGLPLEAGCAGPVHLQIRQTLELPGHASGSPALWATDVDGDGRIDLIVAEPSGDEDRVTVFFGTGDGLLQTAGELDPRHPGRPGSLVAVADLNHDGRADFVRPRGVFVTAPSSSTSAWAPLVEAFDGGASPSAPWSEAVVADFNRDGDRDVAVSGPSGGVELLLGLRGGRFSDFLISGVQPAERLAPGDFNGDGVTDLAGALVGPAENRIAVMYGNVQGPLDPPVQMGRVGRIDELLSTRFPAGSGPRDLRSDLFVRNASVADPAVPTGTTILYGSAARRLVAPIAFLQSGELPLAPDIVVAGSFEPDASSVVVWVNSPEPAAFILPRPPGGDLSPSPFQRADLPSCLPAAHTECLRALAADIEDEGRDRIVAAGPTRRCGGEFGETSQLWVIETPLRPVCTPSELGTRLTVEDLFVQPERRNVGGGVIIVTTTEPDGRGRLIRRGPGGVRDDIALPAEVQHARSAAWLNADADPELELFVLARDGIFRAEADGTGWRFDPVPTVLPGLVPPISDGQIRARDLNEDGLEDLVVGTTNALAIYLSVERTAGDPAR